MECNFAPNHKLNKVIHVNKTDVAMGKDREFMLIGAAAEILPMLLERIEAGKT